METSERNRVSPSTGTTPDLIAQKSAVYGVAVEVKKSLPQDQTHWGDTLNQLLKYDDELTGWQTANQKMTVADACLLIHQSRGRLFIRFMKDAARRDASRALLNGAVIEFNRSDEATPYIFFRREHGNLRDNELNGQLADGTQVPVQKVLTSYPNLRYYDAEPSLEYMMQNLWMDHLASRAASVQPNERGVRDFTVTVAAITAEAQRGFGSGALTRDGRSATFPDSAWVRKGLEGLVRVKLAKTTEQQDTYAIQFRTLRGTQDLLERFVALLDTHKARAMQDDGQLSLLTPLPPATGDADPPAT